MNSQDIWMGNEYAYVKDKPNKAGGYIAGAKRVRAMRLYKQMDPQAQRQQSMVDVQFLDVETGMPIESGYYSTVRSVRARDFLVRWEDYKVELIRRQREEEARERLYQERLRQDEEKRKAFYQHLETRYNLPRKFIQGMNARTVYLDKRLLEETMEEGVVQVDAIN